MVWPVSVGHPVMRESKADQAVNIAVLGTVGFFSYKHWNEPWDRRIVAGVTAGLFALSGLEG